MNIYNLRLSYCNSRTVKKMGMLLTIALAFLSTGLRAQSYKAYISLPDQKAPLKFSANQVSAVPNSEEFVIIGDYKAPAPDYDGGAFILRTDNVARTQFSRMISTNFPNATNGVVGKSVAVDQDGNYFMGGASVQNVFLGGGSERTITMFDATGTEIWSRMQPNYCFEAILSNPKDGSIVSISGPYGNSNPNTDLMINRLTSKGDASGDFILNTPTVDHPINILATNDGGYLALGEYNTSDPSPLLIRLDKNLEYIWSFAYPDPSFEHEVVDFAQHKDGFYVVAGRAIDKGSSKSRIFLLGINDLGNKIFYHTYDSPTASEVYPTGIAAYSIDGVAKEDGFLVSGYFVDPVSGLKRSCLMKTDKIGKVQWSRNYSNLTEITDADREEIFTDVIFYPHTGEFVAVGEFTESFQGNTMRRELIVVRADVVYGVLSEMYNTCAKPFDLTQGSSSNVNRISVGSPNHGGGVMGFSYQSEGITTRTSYCAFPTASGGSPKGEELVQVQADKISGKLSISYDLIPYQRDGLLELFDMNGRRITSTLLNWQQNQTELSLESYPSGAYMARILVGDKLIGLHKILNIK